MARRAQGLRACPRPRRAAAHRGLLRVPALARLLCRPGAGQGRPGHPDAPPRGACRQLLSRREGGQRRVHRRGRGDPGDAQHPTWRDDSSCRNVSKYSRDVIRRDKERVAAATVNRLEAELNHAFAAPEPTQRSLAAAEVNAKNQGRSRSAIRIREGESRRITGICNSTHCRTAWRPFGAAVSLSRTASTCKKASAPDARRRAGCFGNPR